jgi:hypothetical protein
MLIRGGTADGTESQLFDFLLLIFLDLDHFLLVVVTALRTDNMRQAHGTAVLAGDEVLRFNGVMGTAAVAATF